jgi:hypothetical protein
MRTPRVHHEFGEQQQHHRQSAHRQKILHKDATANAHCGKDSQHVRFEAGKI